MTEVSREAWEEIQREIREGTPNTPERIAFMREADAIYAKHAASKRSPAGAAPEEGAHG